MTTLEPNTERARLHAARMVEIARVVLEDPDNMRARKELVSRTFNLDWLAAALVTLATPPKP